MAATLPQVDNCCIPCDNPTVQNIPGPAGANGANGTDGTDGINAFTALTANYTMPAELAIAVATVGDTSWMVVGEVVFVQTLGYLEVMAIGSSVLVTLKNLEDTPSNAYASNAAPGTIAPIASKVSPGGIQGPTSSTSGAAGGDLKGTYPNPRISVANTKGSLIVGDGTNSTAVAVGTNGFVLDADSTAGNGVAWKHSLPITGDANLADNRIARLDGAVGTPIPLQSSLVTVTDTGALRADGSGGNARGTDAVDLQVTRAGATQVASGTRTGILAGQNNTCSTQDSVVVGGTTNEVSTGLRSAIVGGNSNTVTDNESFIGGGLSNGVSGEQSAVVCGDTNGVSGDESFIGSGNSNVASANTTVIGGGSNNTATAVGSCVVGGQSNSSQGQFSAVLGGSSNTAGGTNSIVSGGDGNSAAGNYATVPGGSDGTAPLYGQYSRANGAFAAQGDAQYFELIWRIQTTDATANVEMFLDASTERALISPSTSWLFDILLVGRSTAGVDASWRAVGLIHNNAGTTAMTCASTMTSICDGTGATWGVVGSFVVNADNAHDALHLDVTGAGATTINWVAHGRMIQVQA